MRLIFRRNGLLSRQQVAYVLDQTEAGLKKAGEWNEQTEAAFKLLRRSPFRARIFVRDILEEAEVAKAGVVEGKQINWEAIGDFIVKIAPVIIEILMLFLSGAAVANAQT